MNNFPIEISIWYILLIDSPFEKNCLNFLTAQTPCAHIFISLGIQGATETEKMSPCDPKHTSWDFGLSRVPKKTLQTQGDDWRILED